MNPHGKSAGWSLLGSLLWFAALPGTVSAAEYDADVSFQCEGYVVEMHPDAAGTFAVVAPVFKQIRTDAGRVVHAGGLMRLEGVSTGLNGRISCRGSGELNANVTAFDDDAGRMELKGKLVIKVLVVNGTYVASPEQVELGRFDFVAVSPGEYD